MFLIKVADDSRLLSRITVATEDDFELLTENRYFFDWKAEQEYEIYKLTIQDRNDILGLVSFQRMPEEYRIHIRLLTVSRENRGREKNYQNIAANLLTYVAKEAVKDFAELACVSLKPKSEIVQHYISKYGMNVTGTTLSIEIKEILELIQRYDKV